MSAGTLTLTNNSAAVSGSGTAFTTELAAGDFAVVTVGGIPYTLPVKTVNSNTSLTLVSNFTGPTQSGTAWYAVPRIAMNLVTAAAVTQAAEALRGLNYDKQNWQNIFSGTGNVTVKLPDGSIWTGPAWNGIASTLSGKMDKSKNLDDVNDKNESRKNLGLGSAATRNVGIETGNVIIVGGFGIGTFTPESVGSASTSYATDLSGKPPGIYRTATGTTPDGLNRNGVIEKYSYSTSLSTLLFITTDISTPKAFMQQVSGSGAGSWAEFYTTINTTKASDGTIKAASPIVQIFHDGRCQLNEESEGCTVARLATGEYLVEGCTGLNADAAWGGIDGGFDIPKDRNGQPLVWLDYDVNPDGSVLVKTFHRTYRDSPAFARNLIGIKDDAGNVIEETVKNGDPIDIPTDQYVSVRVEMPSDSLWNKRQEEAREAMEKAEREQAQLDAQS